ncbi:MAG TPA: pectin acetylesterase-family hydrolase [Steroidobacteraceae bacterium]
MRNLVGAALAAICAVAGSFVAFSATAGPVEAGPWTVHEHLAPVVGTDGKTHSATCSGLPGTDPAFKFWSKKGASKNLVVYFEGGGACWDSLTCTFPIGSGLPAPAPQFYVAQIAPGTNPANYSGLFDQSNPANPVKDWSFVYIPYCTGDIHTGSATKQYFNVGNPFLGPNGTPYTIQHRGFDNFMVVLDWIRKNFDAPKSILVTGSSAGGYGATANFPYVADSYPNAHMYVLADASQGVTTPAFDNGNPGRNSWNPQLPQWIFGTPPSSAPSSELLSRAAAAYPRAKISQFTTVLDEVQVGFYGVMKQFYGPGGSCPNPAVDWNQQMIGTLNEYGSNVGNFRHYLASGSYHTIMRSPLFYTENSAGIAYSGWLASMLANRGGTGGSGGGDWKNVACPDCTTALPCP